LAATRVFGREDEIVSGTALLPRFWVMDRQLALVLLAINVKYYSNDFEDFEEKQQRLA
jgi:hypothetical protein